MALPVPASRQQRRFCAGYALGCLALGVLYALAILIDSQFNPLTVLLTLAVLVLYFPFYILAATVWNDYRPD